MEAAARSSSLTAVCRVPRRESPSCRSLVMSRVTSRQASASRRDAASAALLASTASCLACRHIKH